MNIKNNNDINLSITGDCCTARFVRVIGTVHVSVTQRRIGDASAGSDALEFRTRRFVRFDRSAVAVFFVFLLGAVRLAIAHPRLPNTVTVVTLEVIGNASMRCWRGRGRGGGRIAATIVRTTHFIRSIGTIVLSITLPPILSNQ